MPGADDHVTFTVDEDYPHDQALNFSPPYVELAANVDGFVYWWRMLVFVFDLPNPNRFPRVAIRDPDSIRRVARYVATCQELAASTVLSHTGGLKLHASGPDQEVEVAVDNPSMEALRGTLALFRQIDSDQERASFTAARKAIETAVEVENGPDRDQQREWIKKWRAARGKLNAYSLRSMVQRKIVTADGAPADFEVVGEHIKPSVLIKRHQYGDLIHWGDEREALDALRVDKIGYEISLFEFISCIIQLSHIYLGFAIIASRADQKL